MVCTNIKYVFKVRGQDVGIGSFTHVGPWDQSQIIRLASKSPYSFSHFCRPVVSIFYRCVYIGMGMYMCRVEHAPVCVCTWRLEINLRRGPSKHHSTCFWDRFLTCLEFINYESLTAQQTPGILSFFFPTVVIMCDTMPGYLFNPSSGDGLQNSCMGSNILTVLSPHFSCLVLFYTSQSLYFFNFPRTIWLT